MLATKLDTVLKVRLAFSIRCESGIEELIHVGFALCRALKRSFKLFSTREDEKRWERCNDEQKDQYEVWCEREREERERSKELGRFGVLSLAIERLSTQFLQFCSSCIKLLTSSPLRTIARCSLLVLRHFPRHFDTSPPPPQHSNNTTTLNTLLVICFCCTSALLCSRGKSRRRGGWNFSSPRDRRTTLEGYSVLPVQLMAQLVHCVAFRFFSVLPQVLQLASTRFEFSLSARLGSTRSRWKEAMLADPSAG